MAGVDPRPSPPWVQEAARLRAEGHSLRGIVYLLNGMGFGVACHNSIRYWLEPEFRERKNAIAREFWARNHPKTRWRRRR